MADGNSHLRIGELSRRVGVEPALLRAWEKRYGLLDPMRSEGNFRLYSLEDVARVTAMKRHLSRGLAAAEAADLAIKEEASPIPASTPDDPSDPSEDLYTCLIRLDEQAAHERLDRIFSLYSLEHALEQIILPCLRKIGDGWGRGDVTVAQEHFASGLIRARLLSIGRGWSAGSGPMAVLACPSGEDHDIGLICFGLLLWRQGWRISYIGADAPVSDLAATISAEPPDLVVLAALEPGPFTRALGQMKEISAGAPLVLAGAGATKATAASVGAVLFDSDPISAAREIAAAQS